MGQISRSDAQYAGKRKKTRREVFLAEIEAVVPWKALLDLIEADYPVAGRGRPPNPLASMLRVHLMRNWFALSDPAMEEALYEIASLRAFANLSLSEPIPDETTILNFHHLLETYDLAEDIFKAVNKHLEPRTSEAAEPAARQQGRTRLCRLGLPRRAGPRGARGPAVADRCPSE